MGKKLQGAALRAKKRAQQAGEELLEQSAAQVESLEEVKDDALFVLDTTAVVETKNKRQLAKEAAAAKVEKGANNKRSLSAASKAEKAPGAVVSQNKRPKRTPKAFDLWGDEDKPSASSKIVTPAIAPAGIKPAPRSDGVVVKSKPALKKPIKKSVAVDVALPGQSIHPDPKHHQKMLQAAVDVEKERQAALEKVRAPLANGMSDFTKQFLVHDSSDEEDEDDDHESSSGVGQDDNVLSSSAIKPKSTDKLTRAQRNKQKRVRQQERAIQEQKQKQKAQRQINQAKTHAKQLAKEERARQAQKESLKAAQEGNERVLGTNVPYHPIEAPTVPVALSRDVNGGNLRTVKPKGSLLQDRFASMVDRKLATGRNKRERRKMQGKKRKLKVRGEGWDVSRDTGVMG